MAAATWASSYSFARALQPLLTRHTVLSPLDYGLRRFKSAGCLFFSTSSNKPPKFTVYAQARRVLPSKTKGDELASPADLCFEGPLKIVEYPDPILRAKNKRIGTFDDNLKKLVDEMFDIMYKTDGIGLSAPQVGMNVQLMVFNAAGERGEGEEIVLVNPRVSRYSRRIILYDEGCLSFPEIYGDVERPDSVKVDAQDINGARFEITLSALPARVFQHEFDHLQGVLFFEKMTDEVLDTIREDLVALEKKYEEKTGLPTPESITTRKLKKAPAGFGKS
ncbi:peptide deformylase 1B, chloroplastic [Nicotiana tabacum]|uniref:Peptide deformylase n=1 Tax=Nicotiana tabacum TaxID=4097 RepID=A0A1S4BBH9_TOBAC|nr:PREDICTED: peptide deformylase 1B, chloroplastic-like [Nicotiana tabacum]XP_033515621.1 peptide deformylase 1B, chloroplastic [Nicotiana tomentosiformis]